jgi:hypothetical protein
MQQNHTITGAAEILRRDRRSVRIALRDTPPDGQDSRGRDAWAMSTIASAMSRYDQQIGRQPGGHGGNARLAQLTNNLATVVERLDGGMARLRAEPDLEARRELAKVVGPDVGALDRAFAAVHDALPEDDRPLCDMVCDGCVGQAMNQLIALCEWTLGPAATNGVAAGLGG